MPVPSTIADLTTSEATNSPADSETITATTRPSDYLRAHAAIIKTLAGSVTTDIAAAVSAHAGSADPHTGYALESALGTASTKNTGTTSGTVPLVGTSSATDALAGLVELADTGEAAAGTDTARAITPAGLRGGLNATGTAPVYACRAWVNFDGTSGSIGSGRANGNVSSITDSGIGLYIVNFANAMPDANYSVSVNVNSVAAANSANATSYLAGSVAIQTTQNGALADFGTVSVSVFR